MTVNFPLGALQITILTWYIEIHIKQLQYIYKYIIMLRMMIKIHEQVHVYWNIINTWIRSNSMHNNILYVQSLAVWFKQKSLQSRFEHREGGGTTNRNRQVIPNPWCGWGKRPLSIRWPSLIGVKLSLAKTALKLV